MPEDKSLNDWRRTTPWAEWAIAPLAGDASARRYSRLTGPDGSTAMAMEDPAGPKAIARFARVADALRNKGICTPRIFAQAPKHGLAIMTDMGAETVADILAHSPERSDELYGAIADLLCDLHRAAPPEWLSPLTPEVGAEMIGIMGEYYAPAVPLLPAQKALQAVLEQHGGGPLVFAHRDFHAENLIWRDELHGTDRIGVLDFQDAVAAPPAYDLASLIRDARRDVPGKTARTILRRYAVTTGSDIDTLTTALTAWGVQRNLRLLGVFTRLAQSGKPRYKALMPRVWRQLQADLAHPALRDLAAALRALPAPQEQAA